MANTKRVSKTDISRVMAHLGRRGGKKGGKVGGLSKSAAKRRAARANGAKGGRPKEADRQRSRSLR